MSMEKQTMKKGERPSALGYGCMRFPIDHQTHKIDREKASALLHRAMEAGITYYDTAWPYHDGESESFVGDMLSQYPRDSYYLATKIPCWAADSKQRGAEIIEEQLRRLKTDYIDFYLIHALSKARWEKMKELDIPALLEEYQQQGKLRNIGFSFHDNYDVFKEILTYRKWDFCQIQLNYMDTEHQAGLKGLELARSMDIPVVVMVPDPAGLEQALRCLREMAPIRAGMAEFIDQYLADGCPPTSHSDSYRDTYAPAYRVVSRRSIELLPLLADVDRSIAAGRPVRIALDGPCASGKSTLGTLLAKRYHCPLLHMDDFFLQPEMRTSERLAQPGGNVDYERFDRDVLTPLVSGSPAVYRPWICSSGCFGPEHILSPGSIFVTEGSYSLRPGLREHYTHRVWIEADWPLRRQRLFARGGADVLSRYESLWIPLENRYFEAFQVKDCCSFLLSGNE